MEAQVKALNQKAGCDAVFIVPAGDAVVKLRTLVAEGKAPGITKQSDLFTDAIGHGKVPVVILVSYCNYACITGRSQEILLRIAAFFKEMGIEQPPTVRMVPISSTNGNSLKNISTWNSKSDSSSRTKSMRFREGRGPRSIMQMLPDG